MALKFQYNKTYMQQLNRELKVRQNALPTLVAKESALRVEVAKAKETALELEGRIAKEHETLAATNRLWLEMPEDLVKVGKVDVNVKKIAGVKTPVLDKIDFVISRYSLLAESSWIPEGVEILKRFAELKITLELAKKKVAILEYARKKTTQKVNLYEKVQIPEYKEAVRKIKRYMEDEDNLAKSSQKILKVKIAAEAA
ncbi:MAG: V-type ATP synthase subunit D [Chitinispirillales bacterium]|jgi:V/A-type H+-transporting ATPase subunit D|nr:V-type ATP synthase subunit D [Chitinispirillales bacterium]